MANIPTIYGKDLPSGSIAPDRFILSHGSDGTVLKHRAVDVASTMSGIEGVTSLRAFGNHANNQMAYLLYVATDGDGGEGWFRFKSTDTTTDDGVDYIKPDDILSGDPGRWVRAS